MCQQKKKTKSRGAPETNARAQGHSRALFKPGLCFEGVSYIRTLNRRQRGAQTRGQAKWQKDAKTRAQCGGEGGHAIGTAADRLARVKKSEAEPATTAKGDAHAGASTATRMRSQAGADAQSFRLLNENLT